MGQYGRVAVAATKYIQKTSCIPEDAWNRAAWEIISSKESADKVCPRCAYLGLCEDGRVVGVPEGDYTSSYKNKAYAIIALDLLREGFSGNKTALWMETQHRFREQEHEEPAGSDQGEMDVVLALWRKGLVN